MNATSRFYSAGSPMDSSGHLLPEPEGLESERHKMVVCGSGWLQTDPLGDTPISWKFCWRFVERETILLIGFGSFWIGRLLWRWGVLVHVLLWVSLGWGSTRSRFSTLGHIVLLILSRPVCWCMTPLTCCLRQWGLDSVCIPCWRIVELETLPLVLTGWCEVLFLVETKPLL